MTTDQAVAAALALPELIRARSSPGRSGNGSAALLTSRQLEVAVLVAQGLTNRQIADRLVITPRAAAAHVEHILDKLGAGSRTQIGVWIAERGLLASRTA
jgi:non-specific serine/threonine protein kinase